MNLKGPHNSDNGMLQWKADWTTQFRSGGLLWWLSPWEEMLTEDQAVLYEHLRGCHGGQMLVDDQSSSPDAWMIQKDLRL